MAAPHPGTKGLLGWIDARFPLTKLYKEHMSEYYAPKNFNIWYVFGSLALFVLVNQIISGIWLAMHYKPDAALSVTGIPIAYASVEASIMRDVDWMWFFRYLHSTGASAFFIVVYLHMFRALMYGSYRKPRELVWILGMLIYVVLMAEAFLGYILPYGQMSFWGAQVIINLFSALPYGDAITTFIRGDFVISEATLGRFFALHVVGLPLVLIGLVVAHIIALHEVGSNNPDGIEIKENLDINGRPVDGIPFHPYYTVHDIYALSIFLFFFALVIFYAPEMFGYFLEKPNFEPADPFRTPAHIAPVWYFTPFYSMLRAIPSWFGTQVWGVLVMGLSIVILFFLPWLDRSPVKSIRYKGALTKILLGIFVVCFVVLGYIGVVPTTDTLTFIARVCTAYYLGFFLLMPIWSRLDKVKPVPTRVTMK